MDCTLALTRKIHNVVSDLTLRPYNLIYGSMYSESVAYRALFCPLNVRVNV